MKYFFSFILGIFINTIYLNAQIISAMQVPGDLSKVHLESKAWLSSDSFSVTLNRYTQNPFDTKDTLQVQLKALHNGKHVAFLVEWEDDAGDIYPKLSSEGFVFQLPLKTDYENRLPYLYMGDPSQPVIAHIIKKKSEVVYTNIYTDTVFNDFLVYPNIKSEIRETFTAKHYISKGFGSLEEISSDFLIEMSENKNKKKTLFVRSLENSISQISSGVFPISFFIWQNSNQPRVEKKYISPWIGVKLVGKSGGGILIDKIEMQSSGDPQNGKALSLKYCAKCHQFPGGEFANPKKSPILHNIGATSTYEYLKNAIINPNKVIVPNVNDNTIYPWYRVDDSGNKTTLMPSFESLDDSELEDIISFLQSLK